ncbi:hypothetical protein TIFTF001_013446 [Ficus carica]|uniref:Uncharacterized protein n=1 Tax=Ficus carica TaxID=3494 RepID=A0AA87ZXR4_FICCA|nr:hypothetical protein TIFTF001_013446 [Ficus carica]
MMLLNQEMINVNAAKSVATSSSKVQEHAAPNLLVNRMSSLNEPLGCWLRAKGSANMTSSQTTASRLRFTVLLAKLQAHKVQLLC